MAKMASNGRFLAVFHVAIFRKLLCASDLRWPRPSEAATIIRGREKSPENAGKKKRRRRHSGEFGEIRRNFEENGEK